MKKALLCRYDYDPLDRLTGLLPPPQAPRQRFYRQNRLATDIQGDVQHTIVQHSDQLLALQRRDATSSASTLLATDPQHSVLYTVGATEQRTMAYSPYGHHPTAGANQHLLGFNGECADPVTGHYLLGNGYRAFNPVLMRFNSPDSWSPFGKGGVNSYAYCINNPINNDDSSGHIKIPILARTIARRTRTTLKTRRYAENTTVKYLVAHPHNAEPIELVTLTESNGIYNISSIGEPHKIIRKDPTLKTLAYAALPKNLEPADVNFIRQIPQPEGTNKINFLNLQATTLHKLRDATTSEQVQAFRSLSETASRGEISNINPAFIDSLRDNIRGAPTS
ncbi:RHS repeat-associated core domain-containing protein [Pseudomonas lundensis]|uniref:RHS repeat-associated core domain-containing protein n=1 Tax=Pseudomonas lundensis TaxID=86185 RepID=UPI001890FEC5|nr:RHS repeat-associated core domain-containing protein [Pseudomonas lundensis]QOF90937.1 RHS repeat-associated core domain-containing protein [Pseudomonas lundensis]